MDKKEIAIAGLKSLLGEIPFVGSGLNELIDFRANLKQNRLNNFIELLAGHFTENQDVNLENIKREDFSDLFESVIIRVVKTKSQKKLLRFKNVLINELKNPTNKIEFADLYLDLISSLSEEELVVLFHHKNFDKVYDRELEEFSDINEKLERAIDNRKSESITIGPSKYAEQITELETKRRPIIKKHEELKKYRKANFYDLEEEKFFFYKQRLYSKGLLYDNGMGRIGIRPFEMMSITEFGTEFIEFIMTE